MEPTTAINLAILGYRLGSYGHRWFQGLKRKPELPGKAPKLEDFGIPRTEYGAPVPIIWGRDRVRSPIVIWAGNVNRNGAWTDINGEQVLVAKYRLDMHFLLGIAGSQDSLGKVATLRRIWFGEKEVLGWSSVDNDNNERLFPGAVNDDLLGGLGFGGGVAGPNAKLWFDPGDFRSNLNTEIQDRYENAGLDGTLMPVYDGYITVFLQNFGVGESPRLEPISFEVECPTLNDFSVDPFPAILPKIGDGDANPVNVLYDIITNKWGRLGLATTLIDTTSFYAAGQTLDAEQCGFSYVLEDSRSAVDVLEELLKHVEGVLYFEPTTELIAIALIRGGYDVGALPAFSESNILELQRYTPKNAKNAINQVTVRYLRRDIGYLQDTAHANHAPHYITLGERPRLLTIDFPGCKTPALAQKLATRVLRNHCRPFYTVRLLVNRDAATLRPGSVIKWSWSKLGISNDVLRVLNVDLGAPGNEAVAVDCIQDAYFDSEGVFDPLDPPDPPLEGQLAPKASTERLVQECPRWIQVKAEEAGLIGGADQPHGHYLAVPRGTIASHYRASVALDAATFTPDTELVAFPGRAQVETAYSRALDPYDTVTGLRVKNVAGVTLGGATAVQIKNLGRNLAMLVSTAGVVEIVSWETVTDLGGGVFRLNNLSRGLLDTVPRAWAIDDRIYFISGINAVSTARVGINGLVYQTPTTVRTAVAAGTALTEPTVEPYLDDFTPALRFYKPYPVADLQLAASKAPAQFEEEGVDVTWKRRDRLSDVIIRGDAATETVEVGTTYDIYGKMITTAVAIALVTGETGSSKDDVHLGKAGYGSLAVSVRSQRNHTLPDDTVVNLASHQDPEISIVAVEWRNQLLNPRFAGGALTNWTTVQGSPSAVTPGIGGAGYYVTGLSHASGNCELTQTQWISGYQPERLRAELDVLTRNFNADAGDTLTLELIALSSVDAVLSTTTYGPTAQSTTLWNRRTANNANLPAGTAKVKARVLLVGVGDTTPDSGVTELRLRVGQFTNQLLLNPEFETGLTSWTAITGTFQVMATGTLYLGAQYVKGDAAADSGIYQEYLLSGVPGFEVGADLVLEFARMNDNANGLGTVTVEFRDAGGALSSIATASENVGTTWVRKRLSGTIPVGCDRVRVILQSTRQSATASACFDDFDLRIHKHLDADDDRTRRFDSPVKQQLPKTIDEWEYFYPTIAKPDYGFWSGGSLQGVLGTEPDMQATSVTAGAVFTGMYSESVGVVSMATDALACTAAGAKLETEGNVTFANFTAAGGFTIVAALKSQQEAATALKEICSRLGTTGWRFSTTAGGLVEARLVGTLATKTATSAASIIDACPHMVAMIYNPAASQVHVVVDDVVVTTSTAGMGEIRCNELIRFVIGKDWLGQLARLWMWQQALSTANVQAIMTHGADPSGALLQTRSGVLAAAVGSNANGALVSRFNASQVAIGYSAGLVVDGGTGFGLVQAPSMTNLIPKNDLSDTATWVRGVNATFTSGIIGPEGTPVALNMSGSNLANQGLEVDVPLTADPNCLVVWFARRSSGSGSAMVRLVNTSSVVKENHTYTPNATWTMHSFAFTGWDDSTANARLRFQASESGTVKGLEICGPFYVSADTKVPAALPIGLSAVAFTVLGLGESMPVQFNHEGEIAVTGIGMAASPNGGCVFIAANGTNNNDRRDLTLSGTSQAQLEHYDGAAANVVSETTAQVWNALWTVRGRWCRAGLVEPASAFAGVVFGNDDNDPADHDRVATFSAGTLALDDFKIGGVGTLTPLNMLVRSIRLVTRESRLPEG